MNSPFEQALASVTDRFIAYLPNLLAGGALILLGWILGWIAKRIVVQVLSVLKPDQFVRRFRWGSGFSRADVRHAFYDFLGNGAFLVIFLIMLNASLGALQLTMVSEVLEQAVLFVPRLLVAAIIFGIGWLLAAWIGGAIRRALVREDVPRATLIARFSKAVIVLFFAAMALTEIDVSREIVIIGFTVTMVTLGVLAVVVTTMGGKRFVSKLFESLEE